MLIAPNVLEYFRLANIVSSTEISDYYEIVSSVLTLSLFFISFQILTYPTPSIRVLGSAVIPLKMSFCIDGAVIFSDIPDWSAALALIVAAYFLLDISYPIRFTRLLDFFENFVVQKNS